MTTRYERQARFRPLGEAGQARIERGFAVVVGCGAVGTAAAELLARAGIGRLRLVDRDVVEVSNLHRLSLLEEEDARQARPKAPAAAAHLRRLRPDLDVEAVVADFDGETAAGLLQGADVVLDGTDNFEARHLLNEACLRSGTPWVHAACLGAQAVAWAIVPGRGACFACVVPDVPGPAEVATCETEGVIGPAAHAAAAAQVTEALKLLAGAHGQLLRGPWTADTWRGTSAVAAATPDPSCRTCARGELRFLGRRRGSDVVPCGRNAVQLSASGAARPGLLDALARSLEGRVTLRRNEFLVRFPAGEQDVTVFADGRVLVSGTSDVARARSIVAAYLGG